MEKYSLVLLLQVIILAVCIQSGLSVKCYMCNSGINDKCGDPADKMHMDAKECTPAIFQEAANKLEEGISSLGKAMNIDIPSGHLGQNTKFACQKIKVVGDQGSTVIMRGCTVASSVSGDTCSEGIEKITGGKGKVEYCGTCEEDYCNGTNRQTLTGLLMFVPCIAAIVSRWVSI